MAIEGAGGAALWKPSMTHPWHPDSPVKQLLLSTHFTDEVSDGPGGKRWACGCGWRVGKLHLTPSFCPLVQAAPQHGDAASLRKLEKQYEARACQVSFASCRVTQGQQQDGWSEKPGSGECADGQGL